MPNAQAFDFESKSRPGTYYQALIRDDGRLTCNCKGWTMKKVGQARRCTHTDTVAVTQGVGYVERGDYVYIVFEQVRRPNVQQMPIRREPVRRAFVPRPAVPAPNAAPENVITTVKKLDTIVRTRMIVLLDDE